MSARPPKIVIPGLNRGAGVPGGYLFGRLPGSKQGPAQLLGLPQLRAMGLATTATLTASTSLVQSVATSQTTSLSTGVSSSLSATSGSVSGAVSSVGSLSTAVSTVISGSISAVNSAISSLSTAVGGGTGTSTSLSQISSSLSGAISSTSSLSTAVSTVDANQSTSLSANASSITSLSTAVSSVGSGQSTSLSQISTSLSTDLSLINSLSTALNGYVRSVGQSAVKVSHTGDLVETTLATITLPVMGANDILQIEVLFSHTGTAGAWTPKVKLGSTIVVAGSAQNATNLSVNYYQLIGNRNSTSSQVLYTPTVTANFGATTVNVVTPAESTGSGPTITITGQLANAGDTISLERYLICLIPG